MRRFLLVPALMISLLLSGCGSAGAAEERIEKQRDALATAERICFTADVTADLGDEVFACTLDCEATPEQVSVTVMSPEPVAGICAHTEDGDMTLEYEGVTLSLGDAAPEGLTPMNAAPLLAEALRSGHVQRVWMEQDGETHYIAAEIYAGDTAELTLWFERETLVPAYAEFYRDGAAVLRCGIRDFTAG